MKKQLSLVLMSVALLVSGQVYGAQKSQGPVRKPQPCAKVILPDALTRNLTDLSDIVRNFIDNDVKGMGLELVTMPLQPSVIFPTASETVEADVLAAFVRDLAAKELTDQGFMVSINADAGFACIGALEHQVAVVLKPSFLDNFTKKLVESEDAQGFFGDRGGQLFNPHISLLGVKSPGCNTTFITDANARESWARYREDGLKPILERLAPSLKMLEGSSEVNELVVYEPGDVSNPVEHCRIQLKQN